jgi:hypothetical protein
MLVARYQYLGVQVDIWFNSFHTKYVWTLGTSPDRFYGPCEYFATVEEAKSDAEKELNALQKEGSLGT